MLRIRDAEPGEEKAIASLTRLAYAEYAAVMHPSAWSGLQVAVESGLASAGVAERIVAVSKGRIVGSVLLLPANVQAYEGAVDRLPWPEVRLLAVDPASRGMGIGRALMNECIRRTEAAGASHLGLHTSESMRTALELYRRMGFERAPAYDFRPPGGELVEAYTLPVRLDRRPAASDS